MQDTLQPKANQVAEEGIKPAGKATKDAVLKAQDQIPDPEQSKKVAEEQVSRAAKPAAQAVKDNAQPLADKVHPFKEIPQRWTFLCSDACCYTKPA